MPDLSTLPPGFCDGFTDDLRESLLLACQEAARLGENYISTEHLLLAITRQPTSNAATILWASGVALERIYNEIERSQCRCPRRIVDVIRLTPRAIRVFTLARESAETLGDTHLGTEHLLLGLVVEGEGLAARVLVKLGVTRDGAMDTLQAMRTGSDW